MRKIVVSGLAAALLLGTPWIPRCRASDPDAEDVGFASVGVGGASVGPAGVVSLNFSRGDFFYGARVSTSSEFEILGPDPPLSNRDYALLAGACTRSRLGFASAAIGIGFTESVRRGRLISSGGWFESARYKRIDHGGVSLPVDLKATVHGRHLGLGLNVFGEIAHDGFIGVALILQAGQLGAAP